MKSASHARTGQVVFTAFGNGQNVVVGTLTRVDEAGIPYIDFPGNTLGPLAARIVSELTSEESKDMPAVALVFEGADRSKPLILGVVSDRVSAMPTASPTTSLKPTVQREVTIDGDSIQLNATSELQLRCGDASISLRRDGKLVIKGTEVVSRASGANKIRGGLVNIN
jgi:Domain of unknown function (DUF6484)